MVDFQAIRQAAGAVPPPADPTAGFRTPAAAPQSQPAVAEPERPRAEEPEEKPEDLQDAVTSMNRLLDEVRNQRLEFGIHEGAGQFYVQVIDRRTRSVVKVMPPQALLDLKAKFKNTLGMLFDDEG